MNKLYISLLSTMFCIQQTHSMELTTLTIPPSNDDGYPIIYKPMEERPVVKLSREYNEHSEKLYEKGLTKNDIEKLIKDGAVLNYKTHKSFTFCSIPQYFSFDGSKQGVENMR